MKCLTLYTTNVLAMFSRYVNIVAHDLAKTTTKQVLYEIWMKEISTSICDIVLLRQHIKS
jgi:hypothetical protein